MFYYSVKQVLRNVRKKKYTILVTNIYFITLMVKTTNAKIGKNLKQKLKHFHEMCFSSRNEFSIMSSIQRNAMKKLFEFQTLIAVSWSHIWWNDYFMAVIKIFHKRTFDNDGPVWRRIGVAQNQTKSFLNLSIFFRFFLKHSKILKWDS